MKLVLLACLAALAAASPQFGRPPFTQPLAPSPYRIIQVLRDSRTDRGDGNYNYEFETENGIYTNIQGRPGSAGQTNQAGSFRFTLPDGTLAEVNFVADENGYRAESPLIPVAPPLPQHAIDQIRFAEEERARGVQYDNHGFRMAAEGLSRLHF